MWRKLALAFVAVSFVGCASAPHTWQSRKTGLFDKWYGSKTVAGKASRPPVDEEDLRDAEETARGLELKWPLANVRLTSKFGKRERDFHEGIDLSAKTGTPVLAAQAGTVAYAGSKIRGYGKLVVIRHRGGISTVYAHNSKILVIVGNKVSAGQKIALSGATGRVSGAHVHFEVRAGVTPIDPMGLLPAKPVQVASADVPARRVAQRRSRRRSAARAIASDDSE